ncbi:hypothetical protein PENSPDRAFT_649014 [Peniophora sp. CONT]|nr:hypothetical protein PENSPDRAFT_649014 [Peniophora sp. CONT]
MFHQCGSIDPQISFLEENLARFPALETVSRLDLSLYNLFYALPPPTQVLRRFVGTTQLVLVPKFRSVLDEIVRDATLLSQLECLELLGFRLQGSTEMVDMSELLEAVQEARPSLVKVVLRGCKIKEDVFEDVFGKCHVQVGELSEARSAWFDRFA